MSIDLYQSKKQASEAFLEFVKSNADLPKSLDQAYSAIASENVEVKLRKEIDDLKKTKKHAIHLLIRANRAEYLYNRKLRDSDNQLLNNQPLIEEIVVLVKFIKDTLDLMLTNILTDKILKDNDQYDNLETQLKILNIYIRAEETNYSIDIRKFKYRDLQAAIDVIATSSRGSAHFRLIRDYFIDPDSPKPRLKNVAQYIQLLDSHAQFKDDAEFQLKDAEFKLKYALESIQNFKQERTRLMSKIDAPKAKSEAVPQRIFQKPTVIHEGEYAVVINAINELLRTFSSRFELCNPCKEKDELYYLRQELQSQVPNSEKLINLFKNDACRKYYFETLKKTPKIIQLNRKDLFIKTLFQALFSLINPGVLELNDPHLILTHFKRYFYGEAIIKSHLSKLDKMRGIYNEDQQILEFKKSVSKFPPVSLVEFSNIFTAPAVKPPDVPIVKPERANLYLTKSNHSQ